MSGFLEPMVKTQKNELPEVVPEISLKKSTRKKDFHVLVLKKAEVKECFYYKVNERDCRIGVDPNC